MEWVSSLYGNDVPFCGHHCNMIGIIHNYVLKDFLKVEDTNKLLVIENLHDSFVHNEGKKKQRIIIVLWDSFDIINSFKSFK